MSKLYFRYGAMGCGKTMQLLQVAFNYEERGHKVCVMKPKTDTKNGEKLLTRIGPEREVNFCFNKEANLFEKVKKEFPNDEILGDLSDFFKVIGDGTRIRILWALDVSEMCVCDIANVLNMTKSAVSHQLRALREADLVKFRRSGKVVLYSLSDNHVKEIFEQGLVHIQEEKGED